MNLSEGLVFDNMQGLVSNKIHIDRHKPKIGTEDETVVIAFDVLYEDPAKDLSSFIESGNIEHIDVEASDVPNEHGRYQVFVEFQRDHKLFGKIRKMLHDLAQITSENKDNWYYIAYRSNKTPVQFTKENFRRDVVDSASEYRREFIKENTNVVNESINRLKMLIEY